MRFLLDENVPKRVALALRAEGHDVTRVQETPLRGADDDVIWSRAAEEERVFVTADLDFPLKRPGPLGMILIRNFDRVSTSAMTSMLLDTVRSEGDGLAGKLVVVSPGRVRVRDICPTAARPARVAAGHLT